MVRNTTRRQYDALFSDPRYLNLESPAYWKVIAPYREAAGLPPLGVDTGPVDFSGDWAINEDRSSFGRMGEAYAPARLEIVQKGGALTLLTTRIVEIADDQVTEETLLLDGTPTHSEFMNSPRVTTARIAPDGRTIRVESVTTVTWGSRAGMKTTSSETWALSEHGRVLTIQKLNSSPRGQERVTLVFDRR
jgi:hypothetical protein